MSLTEGGSIQIYRAQTGTLKDYVLPMTHPLGQCWEQPDPSTILCDDTHAVMSQQTLKEFAEYSYTIPTGAYVGKMWASHRGFWAIHWYGPSRMPEALMIHSRTVLFTD